MISRESGAGAAWFSCGVGDLVLSIGRGGGYSTTRIAHAHAPSGEGVGDKEAAEMALRRVCSFIDFGCNRRNMSPHSASISIDSLDVCNHPSFPLRMAAYC